MSGGFGYHSMNCNLSEGGCSGGGYCIRYGFGYAKDYDPGMDDYFDEAKYKFEYEPVARGKLRFQIGDETKTAQTYEFQIGEQRAAFGYEVPDDPQLTPVKNVERVTNHSYVQRDVTPEVWILGKK